MPIWRRRIWTISRNLFLEENRILDSLSKINKISKFSKALLVLGDRYAAF